jgi:hypothetical protein
VHEFAGGWYEVVVCGCPVGVPVGVAEGAGEQLPEGVPWLTLERALISKRHGLIIRSISVIERSRSKPVTAPCIRSIPFFFEIPADEVMYSKPP